jgi:hypothetical protein
MRRWRCSAKQVKELVSVAKACQTVDFAKYVPFAIESASSKKHVGWVRPDFVAQIDKVCNQNGSGDFHIDKTHHTPGAAIGSVTFQCDGDATFSSQSDRMAMHTSKLKEAGTAQVFCQLVFLSLLWMRRCYSWLER